MQAFLAFNDSPSFDHPNQVEEEKPAMQEELNGHKLHPTWVLLIKVSMKI